MSIHAVMRCSGNLTQNTRSIYIHEMNNMNINEDGADSSLCCDAGSDSSSSRSETASPSLIHSTSRTSDTQARGSAVQSSISHAGASSYRGGRSCGRGTPRGSGSEAKTTRIRTVLNEKQLHTLRACYSANSRPDALMKEQLVEMTGLSPRVIRVWFQNKRCKDKKRSLALKQLHQRQQSKVKYIHVVAVV